MKVSEFKLRLASEAILIGVVAYFAKKKRIIRYIPLVEDATFCGAFSIVYFVICRVVILFSEVPRKERDFIVCDRYYSLQTPIQREWIYLQGGFKVFLCTYPQLALMSVCSSPDFRSLWFAVLQIYQMGVVLLFNICCGAARVLSSKWAKEDKSSKMINFQQDGQGVFPVAEIPLELELKILSFLDNKSLKKGMGVSMAWHQAILMELKERARCLGEHMTGGLTNRVFRLDNCYPSTEGIEFLTSTVTTSQLNTLPIKRPRNRMFTPKILYLPSLTEAPGCPNSLKIVMLEGSEYLFCSGMKIPLEDLLSPTKQWRFKSYDKNGDLYGHPYPLAMDLESFYFVKEGLLCSAPIDSPLDSQSYRCFNKSIQNEPAIDGEGILYFSSVPENGKATLYAVNPRDVDSLSWSYTFNEPYITTPIIDKSGVIYVGASSYNSKTASRPDHPNPRPTLFAFDPRTIDAKNPQPSWSYSCNDLPHSPVISSDNKLYVVNSKVYVFNLEIQQDFTQPHLVSIYDIWSDFPPVIDAKNRVYVTYRHMLTFAFIPQNLNQQSGVKRLLIPIKGMQGLFQPLLDIHGRVFVVSNNGRVLGIDPDVVTSNYVNENSLWDLSTFYEFDPIDYGINNLKIVAQPVLDSHGRIFLRYETFLLCLEPTV